MQLLAGPVVEGEGVLQPAAVFSDQGLGPVEAQVRAIGEEPAAQEWIAGEHPVGKVDDDGVGVEGISGGQEVAAAGGVAAVAAITRQGRRPLDGIR